MKQNQTEPVVKTSICTHHLSDVALVCVNYDSRSVSGMTGVLLVFFLGIMYTFATQTARTYIFNAFWVTHKLFYVVYILILLHGSSRLLQQPAFVYYFLGPAILFTIDKTVSLSRKRRETAIATVDFHPSRMALFYFRTSLIIMMCFCSCVQVGLDIIVVNQKGCPARKL